MRALVLSLALTAFAGPAELRDETELRRSERLEREVSQSPGWTLQRSRNFFVVSQGLRGRDVDALAARADGMRELVAARLIDPAMTRRIAAASSTIYVYSDASTFESAGWLSTVWAWWRSADASMHVYWTTAGDGRNSMYRGVQSSIVAEVLETSLGDLELAPWFLFGHEEYFAGFELVHGRWVAKPLLHRSTVARGMFRGCLRPSLRELVDMHRKEYFGSREYSVEEAWSLGWSLVWFLREVAGSKGWDSRWGDVPRRYLAEWRTSRDLTMARDFAFDGVDYGELDRAWERFTRGAR